MNINFVRFDSIDSTNAEAIRQARLDAVEGLCIMSRHQTAGRGRHGRVWHSDLDSGLYFSIVLRPELEPRFLPLVTLMAGVAVFDTLQEFGMSPDIKWVNDLLVNEKKIGGILAEAVETTEGIAVIVGIGINLNSRNFPGELKNLATSIESETGRKVSADDLASRLTAFLVYFYEMLKAGNYSDIVSNWVRRSSYSGGKAVRVSLDGTAIEGITDGLEENGALRVRSADGGVTIVQAGDVQQLRKTTD